MRKLLPLLGSMKKGGENKYSNKIKEEYIDIK